MIKKVHFNEMKKRAWNSMKVNESIQVMPYFERKYIPGNYAVSKADDIENLAELNLGENLLLKLDDTANEVSEEINLNNDSQRIKYNNSGNIIQNLRVKSKKDTKNSVVIEFREEKCSYRDVYVDIMAEKNSSLDIILVFIGSNESNNITSVKTEGEDNSVINLSYVFISPNNHHVLNYVNSNSLSKINTRGMYVTNGDDILDIMHYANHSKTAGATDLNLEGIMLGESKKIFKGIINFQKGAIGAEGLEKESVISMSDDIVNKTLPILFCAEEDVTGNHASTIGRLDKKLLYYIQSRGYPLKEAKVLVIMSKLEILLSHISEIEHKEFVQNLLRDKINSVI